MLAMEVVGGGGERRKAECLPWRKEEEEEMRKAECCPWK